jgi:hypothetical protein
MEVTMHVNNQKPLNPKHLFTGGFVNISKRVLIIICLFALLLVVSSCVTEEKPKVPKAPSEVTATPGPGYITVTWKDNSANETGFIVYRKGGTTLQTRSKVGEVGANTTKFLDTDIQLSSDYSYTVIAKNAEGESAQTPPSARVKVEAGIDFMVGTFNRKPFEDSVGTAFGTYYFFPSDGLKDGDLTISITGPPGWNDNEAVELTPEGELLQATLQDGWLTFSRYFIDAVAGEYTLTVKAKDKTYRATATLTDANYRFVPPSSITIIESTASQVTATYTAPQEVVAYHASIWAGRYDEFIVSADETKATTSVFNNLSLVPGSYIVEVATFPVDISGFPEKISPYGVAFDFKSFSLPFPEGVFYQIDSKGAYLPRDPDDTANSATSISLDTLGVSAGECLGLVQSGSYSARLEANRPDTSTSMIGVFNGDSGFIAPGPNGNQEDIESRPTGEGLATDIPQDFQVANLSIVEVPDGAHELLFSPNDSFHSDNGDPNNDYGVLIAEQSCP